MLRHILDQAPLEPTEGPIAVCLAPTRELALQTYNEVRKMARVVELRVTCVYGGSNVSDQVRGCSVRVCVCVSLGGCVCVCVCVCVGVCGCVGVCFSGVEGSVGGLSVGGVHCLMAVWLCG